LQTWLKGSGTGLNIELARVAADDRGVRWEDVGIPSGPPSLPVVVLAGRRDAGEKSFFIDHWAPAPDEKDLAVLQASPAREAMRRELGQRLAVLLYVPGTEGHTGRTENVLRAVTRRWSGKERLDLTVVRVDRSDERERLVLSFIGATETGPDWVGVVFGRGKFMSPLQGEEITETRLNGLLEVLVGECTCLRPASSWGVDIPMVWDEGMETNVAWLSEGTAGPAAVLPADGTGVLASGRRLVVLTVWTLLSLAVIIGLATLVVIGRRNREDAS